ncbi:hypothetical protein [Chelativorans sp. Marseille-P2723]|uniref:hypothetical protein n=1 Tax=Chelativorans sp. Marseille-P2723 TaxID=2709133 RepID=UPI001570AC78|nr:hypothetical protein [Chelativorans sp. Marseille-P2723]
MNDKVPPDKARQGREGFPVLVILLTSLLLVGVVWLLVEIYGMVIDEQQEVETRQSSDIPVEEGGAPGVPEREATE